MLRRAALRLAAAVAVSLLAGACLSPTLPLPPPEEPDTIRPSAEHAGMWEIRGDCYPAALVTLFNERTRKGVVIENSEKDGRYTVEIEAELCDAISLSQEVGTEENGIEQSGTTVFVIEPRDPSGAPENVCP